MKHFVVDNDGNPKKVRRAIAGMKLLAALGRRAEAALRVLEGGGVPDGEVSVLDRFPGPGSRNLSINRVKLDRQVIVPKETSLARLIPGVRVFNPLRLAGEPKWTFEVVMSGRIIMWGSNNKVEEWDASPGESLGHVATAHVRSNGTAVLRWDQLWLDKSDQALKRMQPVKPGSKEAQLALAKMYAMCAVRWTSAAPQEAIAMRAALPGWLMEEGLPALWLQEIQAATKVVGVMAA